MPRYYLNFFTTEKAVIDEDGQVFGGLGEVVSFAHELAQEMLSDRRYRVEWPASRFEVADEEGETILVLPGSEILTRLVRRSLH
jgi:hypothetical protein